MIPAGTGDIPANSEQLAEAIHAGMQSVLQASAGDVHVDCALESPANISHLGIRLAGVELAGAPLNAPKDVNVLGAARIGELTIDGAPVLVHGAAATLRVQVKHCPVNWARDAKGRTWLTLSADAGGEPAPSGEFSFETTMPALQQAVHELANDAATRAGAKLRDLKFRLTQTGERSLRLEADAAASKFMMTAQIAAIAEISLDDAMVLTINDLELHGRNSPGQMVVGTLGDQLVRRWKGQRIDLAQYAISGARLTGATLQLEPVVRITAQINPATA